MIKEDEEIYGYKVKKFLGKGSFGEVYSVENTKTKKIVAMKVINIMSDDKDKYDNTIKILQKEISPGLKLSPLSPFLVRLSEFFISDKYFYIVMEFCSGGDLQKVFNKKKKFSKAKVIKLIYHLANGLKILHNGGMMHRDLKPSNIFITVDEIYKIGDFGTASIVNLERDPTLAGTSGYMAPEVLNSEKYDSKIDIFSLGCILYEIITGRNPFMTETGGISIIKNVNANYERIESNEYPPELVKLCHAMLSLKPFDRPSAEDILQNPIFNKIKKKEERFKKKKKKEEKLRKEEEEEERLRKEEEEEKLEKKKRRKKIQKIVKYLIFIVFICTTAIIIIVEHESIIVFESKVFNPDKFLMNKPT